MLQSSVQTQKDKKSLKYSNKKYSNLSLKIKTEPLLSSISKVGGHSVTTINHNNNLIGVLNTDIKNDKPLELNRSQSVKRFENDLTKKFRLIEKNKSALSEYIINTSFNRKNRFKCINIKLLGNSRYRYSSPLLFVEDQKQNICNTSLGLIPIPLERVRKKHNDHENCKEEEKSLYELQRSCVMSRRMQYTNDMLRGGKDKFNFSGNNPKNDLLKSEDDCMNKIVEIQKWWKAYNGNSNQMNVPEQNNERIEYFKAFDKLKNFMLVKNIKQKNSYISKDKFTKNLMDKIIKIQNYFRLYKAKLLRKKLEDIQNDKEGSNKKNDNNEKKRSYICVTSPEKKSTSKKSIGDKIYKRPIPSLKNSKYKYTYSNCHMNTSNNNFCYISKIVVKINMKTIKKLINLQKKIKSYLYASNKLSKKLKNNQKKNNSKNNSRISLSHLSDRQNKDSNKIIKDNNGFYITKTICKSSENDIIKIQRLIRENILYNSQVIKKPNIINDKNSFDSKTVKNNSIDNEGNKESESSSCAKMRLYYNTETDKNLTNNIFDTNESNFDSINNNHTKNIFYITKNRKINNDKGIKKIQNLFKLHLNSQNNYALLSVYQVQKGKCCFISKNRLIKCSLERYKYFLSLIKLFSVKNCQEFVFNKIKNNSSGMNELELPFYIKTLIRIQNYLQNNNDKIDDQLSFINEIFKNKTKKNNSLLKNICYLSLKDKKLLTDTKIYPIEAKDKLIKFIINFIAYENNLEPEEINTKFYEEEIKRTNLNNINIFNLIKFIDKEQYKLKNGNYCKKCYNELNDCICLTNSENDDDKSMEDDFQTLDIDLNDETESLNIKKKINFFDYSSKNNNGNMLIKTKSDINEKNNNNKLLNVIITK